MWGGRTQGPGDFQLSDPGCHGNRALLRQGGSIQGHLWIRTHGSGGEARKEPSSLAPHFSTPFTTTMSPITRQEVGWFIKETVESQDATSLPPQTMSTRFGSAHGKPGRMLYVLLGFSFSGALHMVFIRKQQRWSLSKYLETNSPG